MHAMLSQLLTEYDTGRVSRRELLGTLAAMLVAPPAEALTLGRVEQLNHVTCFVPDVKRSVEFYRRVLGLSVLTPQPPGVNLGTGSGFLGLYPAEQGKRATIDHFCLAMRGFDAQRAKTALAAQGVTAEINQRGETKELYFTDPDGLRVQVQAVGYIGGVGPLGDRRPT